MPGNKHGAFFSRILRYLTRPCPTGTGSSDLTSPCPTVTGSRDLTKKVQTSNYACFIEGSNLKSINVSKKNRVPYFSRNSSLYSLYSQNNLNKSHSILEKVYSKGPDLNDKRSFRTITAVYSDNGLSVELDLGDWKQEDVVVRVENAWLVVEGSSTKKGPEDDGILITNVIRRYEIPSYADPANMRVEQHNQIIKITVPSKSSPVKK